MLYCFHMKRIEEMFNAYAARFVWAEPNLTEMAQLKIDHTRMVAEAAERIMRSEAWSKSRLAEGSAAAWLHDIGRFEQLSQYGTFQDSKSVDHAELSARVIEEEGILEHLPGTSQRRIVDAVRVHNMKRIPDGITGEGRELAHLVRDADKLDIFRILHEKYRAGEITEHSTAFWNLPLKGPISDRVGTSVAAGEPVEYSWIQSLSDFILIQVGWVISGLHFRETRRIAAEEQVIEMREEILRAFGASPWIDRCCGAARKALDAAG